MQKPMWHRERYQEDLQLPVSKLVYLFQEKQEEQVFQPGGRATTGGVSGEIGAGLGLGAGIKLDVDWTDFALFRKKK